MREPRSRFLEVVRDEDLTKKQEKVNEAVRKVYPSCGDVILFRTTEGHIGLSIESLRLMPGQKHVLDNIWRIIMKTLGSHVGRPTKPETVQIKLRLSPSAIRLIKEAARSSGRTQSEIVEEALIANLGR